MSVSLGMKLFYQATLEGLEGAKGFIRTGLRKRIRLRSRCFLGLHFTADTSLEEGSKVFIPARIRFLRRKEGED